MSPLIRGGGGGGEGGACEHGLAEKGLSEAKFLETSLWDKVNSGIGLRSTLV
jgi:hypothetical protein